MALLICGQTWAKRTHLALRHSTSAPIWLYCLASSTSSSRVDAGDGRAISSMTAGRQCISLMLCTPPHGPSGWRPSRDDGLTPVTWTCNLSSWVGWQICHIVRHSSAHTASLVLMWHIGCPSAWRLGAVWPRAAWHSGLATQQRCTHGGSAWTWQMSGLAARSASRATLCCRLRVHDARATSCWYSHEGAGHTTMRVTSWN